MEDLETGKDKIRQICDLLRRDTLEPAKEEGSKIVEEAQEQAVKILSDAKIQAEALIREARAQIEKERNVFQSSLTQASKQSIDALKSEIENNLFSAELKKVIGQTLAQPEIIAKLISTFIKVIERDGLSADFSAIIPSQISVNDLNRFLLEEDMQKIKDGITLNGFSGGVKLKLKDKNITIDMSDKAVVELLETYLRKDFRKWIFGNTSS